MNCKTFGRALTAVKREKFAKNKKNHGLKGKVVTFTVQSLILHQYPVDLLTVLELYYKSSNYI